MRHVILFIGLMQFAINFVKAQDAAKDFKKINAAYAATKKISMEVVFTVFQNYTSTVPLSTDLGKYKKDGHRYCNSLMGMETIADDSHMLVINEAGKAITLSRAKPLYTPNISGIKMDDLLRFYNKIEYVDKGKNLKGYIVHFNGEYKQLDKYEVYFDPSDFLLRKLVLFYSGKMEFSQDGKAVPQKPRMEIEFREVDTSPSFQKDEFSFEKYLVMGQKITTTDPYKSYRFIESKN